MRGRRFQLLGRTHPRVIATTLILSSACLCIEATALQLSRIPDLTTNEDTPTAAIPVKADTRAGGGEIAFIIKSSNPLLIPESNVILGRSPTSHTLVVTPAPNQSGQAMLEVEATDGLTTVTQSFRVTVTSVNDAPTISKIPDQTIPESTGIALVSFTIGDVETPAASLVVTASSSDTNLLPSTAIALAGTGAARTLSLRPAPGLAGTAVVSVTVNDGESATSQQFRVSAGAVNKAPVANAGPDQTLVGTNSAMLSGTATDDCSSNERLVTLWSVDSGPSGVKFTNPMALNTSVSFSRPGSYVLRLTASDGELSDSDDVTVVVAGKDMAAIQVKHETRR